jgi:K+-sensing histidine kinase KdpD
VKYSPVDSPIRVSLTSDQHKIRIEIADHGSGIPNDEKQRVFGKFYRMGNEETRSTRGTGLGLYITWNVVRLHKGEITIRDNRPCGSIFAITIPIRN